MSRRFTDRSAATETLRVRLFEAEAMLRAIRRGEIDALVVERGGGSQVHTLHSSEEPYRNLVEQMQEGAVVLTKRGDVLYANACFAALVGEPLESIIGNGIVRFVHAADREGFENFLVAGSGRFRCRLIGPDSRTLEVSLSATTTVSTDGGRVNLIVTDLAEMLDANSKREEAERRNRTKDQFLTMLAHELRSPLGAIDNAVTILESTHAAGDAATRAHDVITRQVVHMAQLINDLLDVERVVSGKIRLDRQRLDMADAVRQAVAVATGNAASDRCVEISTENVWVDGDPLRIEQVLTNILTNALKYTPPGGRIRVTLRADGDDAVIRVQDTGVGISATLLPLVFDLYVQAERTLDRARGGLGIGLTLVRRLVELHGGTVEASSDGEGCGSTFTVRLRQTSSRRESSSGIPVPRDRRAKPRRVLLIEDSDDARQMLRMMLELAGHLVYDAPDGVRALAMLNVVQPNVGIIDIGLPVMDGYQVAKRIREDPHGRGMLLLALSGDDSASASNGSAGDGFDYHLVKPVNPEHLERLISQSVEAA